MVDDTVMYGNFHTSTFKCGCKIKMNGSNCRQIRLYFGKTRFGIEIKELPAFITRIHRNNAINVHKIDRVDHEDHVIYLRDQNRGIGIGDAYYPGILRMLREPT